MSMSDEFRDLAAVTPPARMANVNGIQINYLDWPGGCESAPPVLMVHGLSAHAHTWDPIARRLSEGRRVIAIDLRGHGDSGWARDGYDVERFVSDIDAVLKHLNMETIDYIGHSFGAQVGYAFAGAFPSRVRKLVLNDMGPEMASAAVGATRAAVGGADVKGFASEEAAREQFRAQYPEWEEVFVELHARHHVRCNWAGKYVFKSDPDLFWMLGSAGRKSIPYVWEMAARIKEPALLLRGTKSGVLNDELIGKITKAIPHIQVQDVDVGHYYPRERSAEFLDTVRSFLDA